MLALGVCRDLLKLRWALPTRLEHSALDALLEQLTSELPPRRLPRAWLERSITCGEGLVSRLRIVPDTCLYRALARYAVLSAAGIPVRFRMGLRKSSAAEHTSSVLDGHAWVEDELGRYRDEVEEGEPFVVTFEFEAHGRARSGHIATSV